MESRRLYYEWLMIKTEIILWMMNGEGGRQRQENNKKNLLFKARKEIYYKIPLYTLLTEVRMSEQQM